MIRLLVSPPTEDINNERTERTALTMTMTSQIPNTVSSTPSAVSGKKCQRNFASVAVALCSVMNG